MHTPIDVFVAIMSFLSRVPDAVWAAIIASLLTTIGVVLTNRGSNNRLREQLAHDADQRDRARNMDLRLRIYMEVAEAMTAGSQTLVVLSNLEVAEPGLSEQFAKFGATISKAYIIATGPTVDAIMDLSGVMAQRFVQLIVKRVPLSVRKSKIEALSQSISRCLVEQDNMLSLQKDFNLKGLQDKRLWEVIQHNLEFQKKQFHQYTAQQQELSTEQMKEWTEYARECFDSYVVATSFVPSAVAAMRKEMEIAFDEEKFRATMKGSGEAAGRTMAEFFEKLKAQMSSKTG